MNFFKNLKFKKMSKDLLYSIAGICLMNGVIQLLVNPFLQREMGSENFGVVLSLISIISIVAISFGTSFNYSRMIASAKERDCNSDYFLFVIISSLFCLPICLISLKTLSEFSLLSFTSYTLLCVLTLFRYYADANYRLSGNFKGFFLFYFLMTLGYIAGIILFQFFESWVLVYSLAEILALSYVFVKGNIFKCNPLKTTANFKDNLRSSLTLIGSNAVSSFTANIDRPIILEFADANSVTVFYVASLIGKCISLLTAPLNGVLISYLAKYDGKLRCSVFKKINVFLIGVVIALSVICTFVSHIFIKLMYPNLYFQAKPLILLAIIGQMFYFVSGTAIVVLMRFIQERVILWINISHFIIYIILCLIGIKLNGLFGFATGVLLANIARMVLAYVLGLTELKKLEKTTHKTS